MGIGLGCGVVGWGEVRWLQTRSHCSQIIDRLQKGSVSSSISSRVSAQKVAMFEMGAGCQGGDCMRCHITVATDTLPASQCLPRSPGSADLFQDS